MYSFSKRWLYLYIDLSFNPYQYFVGWDCQGLTQTFTCSTKSGLWTITGVSCEWNIYLKMRKNKIMSKVCFTLWWTVLHHDDILKLIDFRIDCWRSASMLIWLFHSQSPGAAGSRSTEGFLPSLPGLLWTSCGIIGEKLPEHWTVGETFLYIVLPLQIPMEIPGSWYRECLQVCTYVLIHVFYRMKIHVIVCMLLLTCFYVHVSNLLPLYNWLFQYDFRVKITHFLISFYLNVKK